ncbi:glucuronyl esterase domain-containing protein [Terriglobus sp. ADX1]|uniref:glucuronyl esterase domain-containing protein n=1 Tax=Terriglobus sp. ADX1 TaxID=2794063 RepID=UPI002FE520A4
MKKIRLAALALLVTGCTVARAQAPVTFTAEQDHQNMMDQLGIKTLRPGPSGDEKAPNHANYDESKANPYPDLPDPLTLKNGKKVTTPQQWWTERRPQIVEDVEREMYGRLPKNIPGVTWRVVLTDKEMVGRTPVIAKRLVGHVDNSAYPAINVDIEATEVIPVNVKGPVPVLVMFGQSVLPSPAQPTPPELERVNEALRKLLAQQDPSLKEIFDKYPAYNPIASQAVNPFTGRAPGLPPYTADTLPATNELVAAGWGYVALSTTSIQADNGQGITRGIIGLTNHGQPRTPEQWGALRAWAWGAARVLDYLETDPAVNSKQVGIEGVSRYGKAALVTMAFEPRFAMGLIGSSGEGGAKLSRRNFGEAVESLTGGEYYWMAGNFMKYGAEDGKFGRKTPGDIPMDAHDLIALAAPRLLFISYGVPEKGDAKWLDQKGSFMATVAAQPVYQLLGAKTLGVPNDYHADKVQMPPVLHGLLDGQLAWRQHDGGHTDLPNVPYFIEWADKWRAAGPLPVQPQ